MATLIIVGYTQLGPRDKLSARTVAIGLLQPLRGMYGQTAVTEIQDTKLGTKHTNEDGGSISNGE